MALLRRFQTEFGTIRITRERDGTLCYYQNGCFHSQANTRGDSVCAYVHVVQDIIRQKKARKVLIIGCGGGTMAGMLRRMGCTVTVVDINPAAFDIARDYFKMPKDVACVVHNGLSYVRKTEERFEAIVIDVFDSHNAVPHGFTTRGFLKAARKLVGRSGIMIMNVMTKNDADRRAVTIARNMAATGAAIGLYDWPGEKDRNTLVVGGSVRGVKVPSAKVPKWMREDMEGLIRSKLPARPSGKQVD